MAGLVPAISLRKALCSPERGHRDKPGDDKKLAEHLNLAVERHQAEFDL